MKIKSAPARLKADTLDAGASGEFEAIVSVFGNVDSWGDVVRHGAFADTIAQWKASPNTLPVLWSHRMDDPTYNIGEILDIAELGPYAPEIPDWVDAAVKEGGGLWVRGRLDTGDDASPIARQALRLMKARRVTQFSYAYDEVDSGWAKADGREIWELRKLRLFEISPTQIGANELTELLAAKARRKADDGTPPEETTDLIRQARDLLDDALDSMSNDDDGSEKAGDKPTRNSPESSRLLRSAIRQHAFALRRIID